MTREQFEELEVTEIVRRMYNVDGYHYDELANILTDSERDVLFGVAFVHYNLQKKNEYETGYKMFDTLLDDLAKDYHHDTICQIESMIRDLLIIYGDEHANKEFGTCE